MLDELHVRSIALIEDATLRFSEQLTVLTGETGAGKTALLAALRLVSGQRADFGLVQDGAFEAIVEARFVDGADEHILCRTLSAKGRSRCQIDGAMATVGELADATRSLHIHSQHEHVQLLERDIQRGYLDLWVDPSGAHLKPYRAARDAYLQANAALHEFQRASTAMSRDLEFARFTLSQIDTIDPQEGEYERLENELPRLEHGQALAQAIDEATSALHDDDRAIDLVCRASEALHRQSGIDAELDELADRLDELRYQLEDLVRDVRSYGEKIIFDAEQLEQVFGRLSELSGIMKRYGPGMEEVFAEREHARAVIESAESSPEREREFVAACDDAERTLRSCAHELSDLRHSAADELCRQLATSVHELAMQDASFSFEFKELPFEKWGVDGSERIELMYQPASTVLPRPLSRIASGGELSRIMLALECLVSARLDSSRDVTMVFDEVDAGIGGVTGTALARKLAQLAQHVQVIVVTHLPQVAALANIHYVVTKNTDSQAKSTPFTAVNPVNGKARVAEIARMLSGHIDAIALDHARALLIEADESKKCEDSHV